MSRQTELLSRLIKNLRTHSLAEAQRLSIDKSTVNLRALASDIVDGFQDQAKSAGLELTFASATSPVKICVDRDRIAQVLVNLLSSALRHTPEGGSVTVKLARLGESVILSVADTGEGLSENALDRVFDRFYRADKGRKRKAGVSGLGLAITKALIELHGGMI